MTQIRITVRNTAERGGTFLTPIDFAFHDGSFDVFDVGEAASAGLESLAEDGANTTLIAERETADADSQGLLVAGPSGPLAPGDVATGTLDVDGISNGFLSFAAMVLPSNDAFIGTDQAVQIFDGTGAFQGARLLTIAGTDVYDAGTEANTELDAAFLNQTGPDTGDDQNGTVQRHPGFNGSVGNPVGEGAALILGGTTATGAVIDPAAGDFTRPDAAIAEIHINLLTTTTGSGDRDVFGGTSANNILIGDGGRDVLFGASGYDDLFGGADRDLLFGGLGDDNLTGGDGNDRAQGGQGRDIVAGNAGRDRLLGENGDDLVDGGADRDVLFGGTGDDMLFGDDARDFLFGGIGDDTLHGGTGNDRLSGDAGEDTFFFTIGDGKDRIDDFQVGLDVVRLEGTELDSFGAVLAIARNRGDSVRIDITDADFVVIRGVTIADLTEANFEFT